MSVDQTKTVDFISTAKDGRVVLTVSDHLEWGADENIFVLHEKLNSCLRFLESGEIYEEYPNARGKELAISIIFKFEPDAVGTKFLNSAKAIIENAGFGFEYSIFSERNQ